MNLRIPSKLIAASAALPLLQNATATTHDPQLDHGFMISNSEAVAETGNAITNSASIPAQRTKLIDEWTPQLERRFLRLAEREALGHLSAAEAKDLNLLSERRSVLKVERTGDEILREYEQRRLNHQLIHVLESYIQFFNATDLPEVQTKEKVH